MSLELTGRSYIKGEKKLANLVTFLILSLTTIKMDKRHISYVPIKGVAIAKEATNFIKLN